MSRRDMPSRAGVVVQVCATIIPALHLPESITTVVVCLTVARFREEMTAKLGLAER